MLLFKQCINIMVTIGKTKQKRKTLRCIEICELVSIIKNAQYEKEVTALRNFYPVLVNDKIRNRQFKIDPPDVVNNIPSICFAAEYRKRDGKTVIQKANPLFLIEINNLVGYAEVEYLRLE